MREQMAKLAAPLSVKAALDKIVQDHTTPVMYMEQAKKDLEDATNFVKEKHLVDFPQSANLQVIPTPESMRGIYSVAGFNAAPALEPQLGAFYWVTPIPSDWPESRIESKLREYNRYGMMEITVHEAMPGHYARFQFANNLEPKSRRVLRSIYGNGPYVEGWAFYTQQLMSDEGFMNNSKELRLTLMKQELRGIANAILDIRLQTMGVTEQQAGSDDERHVPGERGSHGKVSARAVVVVPVANVFHRLARMVGYTGGIWKRKGSAYQLEQFHDAALKESAVPLPALGALLR